MKRRGVPPRKAWTPPGWPGQVANDYGSFEPMMSAAVAAADLIDQARPGPVEDGEGEPAGIGLALADAGHFTRALKAAASELDLAATVVNLLKLHRHAAPPPSAEGGVPHHSAQSR